MEDIATLQELAVIIGGGVIAAFIAVKLRLPTLLGYLIIGIVLGSIFPELFGSEFTENVAQLGAALLLFTVGVEFSLDSIKKVSGVVVIGAVTQALLGILLAIVVLPWLGFTSYEAFLVGTLISTSSTVFVVKMLEEKEQLHTKAGTIMLGWLIMQDLLIVIWFLLFQTYAPNATAAPDLLSALLNAAVVIGLTFGVGRYVLPYLMKEIARAKSEELLVVTVVGVIAIFAVLASAFHISFTIGAFLAGLALSESFLNHEIFTEIKPIRNLFTMIFFVSIGAIFDVGIVFDHLDSLLVILILFMSFKVITIVGLNLIFGVHIKNAIRVGLGISQIGEFAFLGAQLATHAEWISADSPIYSLLVASTIITMSLTPLLYNNVDGVYNYVRDLIRKRSPNLYRAWFVNKQEEVYDNDDEISEHVVVCGYGRVGKYVVAALEKSHIPFLLIEMDATLAEEAKKKGYNIIYGDASNQEILHQAQLDSAKALVVALPHSKELDVVFKSAKQINPTIKIVARTHGGNEQVLSLDMVDFPVEPEFEAAVKIVTKLYKVIRRRQKRALEAVSELQQY